MGFAISRAIPGADKVLPYADLSHTGSLLQKEFWNNPNYKYVDHTYDELGAPALTDVARWVATPAVMKSAAKGAKSYAKGVSGRVEAVKEAGKRPTARKALNAFADKQNFTTKLTREKDILVYALDEPSFDNMFDNFTENHVPAHALLRYTPGGEALELHMNPELVGELGKSLTLVENGGKGHQY